MMKVTTTGDGGPVAEEVDQQAHDEVVRQMHELHRDVGRKALMKAMEALDQMDASTIPIDVAVRLLKFGSDLERKALLGIEPDDDDDPFKSLAGAG